MNYGDKRPVVLFFVKDAVATEEEVEAIEAITFAKVQLRNGEVAAKDAPEKCDFVAGSVPANYEDKPTYSQAKARAFGKAKPEAAADDAPGPNDADKAKAASAWGSRS